MLASNLQNYVKANRTGFRKILKKHDKLTSVRVLPFALGAVSDELRWVQGYWELAEGSAMLRKNTRNRHNHIQSIFVAIATAATATTAGTSRSVLRACHMT